MPPGAPLLAERELAFAMELSVDRRAGARRRSRPSRSPGTCTTQASSSRRSCPPRPRPASPSARPRIGRRSRRRWTPGHPDRGAVPDARRDAGRQRAGATRPQLRPLDDRGRRDVPVRAAHPGDLRAGARVADAHGPRAMVNLLGTGPRREAPLLGVAEALARPGRPPPPLRQARGVRRSQDGPLDGIGATTDQAIAAAARALAKLHWANETAQTEDDR